MGNGCGLTVKRMWLYWEAEVNPMKEIGHVLINCAWALVLASVLGCGTIDVLDAPIPSDQDAGYSDTRPDLSGVLRDGATEEGGAPDVEPAGDSGSQSGGIVCNWDPMPHKTVACSDNVHAVCCYTRPDDSCDGWRTDCSTQGYICVINCP